ncbi:MAG TPA: acyl carrier protein [Kofleriaceae bacterium]|nr:acyl carrier protein [Kofleriaceae bacterium]
MDDTFARVAKVAATRYGRDPSALRPDDDVFVALDIDSVEALELVSAIEAELGVEVPDHALLSVRTFAQLVEAIERGRRA